jgi:adenylate kinase family enzyme
MAESPVKVKLYRVDDSQVKSLSAAWGKTKAQVSRELISEALKARRLKSVGKDETTDAILIVQKKAMKEVLEPLVEEVGKVKDILVRIEGRLVEEFDGAGRQQNFMIMCLRFLVFEVIICRILLRDYVHTAYKVFVESVGKSTKDIERNFNLRLDNYKKEANTTLDILSEKGAGRLHRLADEGSVDDVL